MISISGSLILLILVHISLGVSIKYSRFCKEAFWGFWTSSVDKDSILAWSILKYGLVICDPLYLVGDRI